jgi:sec-independent protein translocase protein TatC
MPEDIAEIGRLTFWEHVSVLRSYILIGGTVFLTSAIAVFVYGENILTHYLLKPLHGQTLVFLSPLGPFLFEIKIAFIGALIVSVPVWLLLISVFVGEALPRRKQILSLGFVATAAVIAAASLAVTYWYLVPASLLAISHFVVPGTSLMVTADSYVSFFLLCAVVAFVVLELPVVIVALSYLRLVNPYALARQRRVLFVGLLILMAVLTPTTDAITLLVVTIPAVLLAELGIAVAKVMYNREAI